MLSWLLTYFVHSTLLIVLAALVCHLLNDRHLPLKEALWRVAVSGGLVTASLQLVLAVQPLGGTLILGASSAPGNSGFPALVGSSPPLFAEATALPDPLLQLPSVSSTLNNWLVAGWLCGAFLLTLTLALAYLRLEGRLRNRQKVDGGPALRMLAGLLEVSTVRRPVGLTSSTRIAVPLAMGWWRREICLPERAIRQLSAEQQENIIAHELAHLERRDPLWLVAMRLLESVLFFQPLNRLARRQLQEIAEFRCDDWAVAKTGRPLTMARCLANVAEWSLQQNQPTPVPALASRGRSLKRRVTRLLDHGHPGPHSPRPAWLLPVASVLLVLTAVAVPGFSVAEPEAPQTPLPSVSETPTGQPDPPAAPEPVREPAAAVAPVEAVPPPAPVTAAPEPPAMPSALAEIRALELEAVRESLERERHLLFERLEDQARDLEKSMVVELERLERIPLERIEALELELEAATKLHRLQMDKIEELHQHLQAVVERERHLRQSELRELHEEQLRLQRDQQRRREEHRERLQEETREQESQEDPPS